MDNFWRLHSIFNVSVWKPYLIYHNCWYSIWCSNNETGSFIPDAFWQRCIAWPTRRRMSLYHYECDMDIGGWN